MKKIILFLVILTIIVLIAFLLQSRISDKKLSPLVNSTAQISVVAKNLEIPWAIAFLPASLASLRSGPAGGPSGDFLFTERVGSLKLISNGKTSIVEDISDVAPIGEGGLMGLALHPSFTSNHFLYVQYTFRGSGNNTLNRVVRYRYENSSLTQRKIIVDNIPGGVNHNGGRIKFGPDGFLYITTGDSGNPSLAQDKNSLAGKILRVTDEGKAAPGNPFNNLTYSYGHRNPQGLAWDDQGRLWETEHGPSAHDEINIIVRGKNYGWPVITGDQTRDGMESPFAQSGAETWAPAGAIFVNNSLFFGGLRGVALFSLAVKNNSAVISKHFLDEFGRIREVILGPDNFLYITTSNLDGRGNPRTNDDKILKIDPAKL